MDTQDGLKRHAAHAQQSEAGVREGFLGSPHVEWTHARTVGHLMQQLSTLPPETGIGAVYFVEVDGKKKARHRGISLSWERFTERGWLDFKDESLPRSLAIWASQEGSCPHAEGLAHAKEAEAKKGGAA